MKAKITTLQIRWSYLSRQHDWDTYSHLWCPQVSQRTALHDLEQVPPIFLPGLRASFHASSSVAADFCLPDTPICITGRDTILIDFPSKNSDPSYIEKTYPRISANRENNVAAPRSANSKARWHKPTSESPPNFCLTSHQSNSAFPQHTF